MKIFIFETFSCVSSSNLINLTLTQHLIGCLAYNPSIFFFIFNQRKIAQRTCLRFINTENIFLFIYIFFLISAFLQRQRELNFVLFSCMQIFLIVPMFNFNITIFIYIPLFLCVVIKQVLLIILFKKIYIFIMEYLNEIGNNQKSIMSLLLLLLLLI